MGLNNWHLHFRTHCIRILTISDTNWKQSPSVKQTKSFWIVVKLEESRCSLYHIVKLKYVQLLLIIINRVSVVVWWSNWNSVFSFVWWLIAWLNWTLCTTCVYGCLFSYFSCAWTDQQITKKIVQHKFMHWYWWWLECNNW
jgi:hypothetical protein